MNIELVDMNRIIGVNKLEEVSGPRLFSSKMTYDPAGILSNEIFGISKQDRRNTFAYINLRRPFIHPHIYNNVLIPTYRKAIGIVAGQKYVSVKDGIIIDDPDNGWTGISNLYSHWDEIDWKKVKLNESNNRSLLVNLKRDQVFIDKILVSPPAYRDVMISGTVDSSDHVSEVNDLYLKLIRSVALLSEGGMFARTQYATQKNIQDTLVAIYNYYKNLISKKQGLIRKYLLGKSVDYGTRSVISAPSYNHERFEDNIIDMDHSAIPIEQCCSNFYPFIEAWVKNFFTREIINDPNVMTFYDPELKREITASIKDPEIQFSEKNVKKMINDYCLNPDNRYKIITMDVVIPTAKEDKILKANLLLKGKVILPNNASTQLARQLTVTDILYLACVDVCEKRHIMISRYPVGTDKGIYFNKIRVQSTRNHIKLVFNGKEYPFYPDIRLDTDHDKVGIQFIDSLVLSNAHLDGMGKSVLM